MADFCKQCSIELFGEDSRELAFHDWQEPKDLAPDEGYPAICEGCGFTMVKGDGRCFGNCLNPAHRIEHLNYYCAVGTGYLTKELKAGRTQPGPVVPDPAQPNNQ